MRAALIGLGMVSRTFGDAIAASDEVELAAVFAPSVESRAAFTSRFGSLSAVEATSIGDIASDPDIDFVILATPPDARTEIVQALVAHGKPMLMEKPIERTLANARALVEMCDQANVPLGIVLQHRVRPILEDLRRVQPTLGAMAAVEIDVPWWRPQSYYDEPGRGTYARDGGGVLLTQAIHTLDLVLAVAGPVCEVTAMAATTSLHDMEAEDFVTGGLIFGNGVVGQLFATTASFPGRGESITFHHASGSARLAAGRLEVHRHDGSNETIGTAADSGAGADPMAFTSEWHRLIIDDFAAALRDGRPPLVTGRDALGVHRLIDALETSARIGKKVLVG